MKNFKIITIIVLMISIFITTGFSKISKEPQNVYRVYLKGESLGLIKSKTALENYINKEQEEIKEKYNVNKVYVPEDLDIVKETTYSKEIKTTKEIYEEIKDISPFTIRGYAVKIKGIDTKDSKGKKVKGKTNTIYILDKKIFSTAVDRTVKSFIPKEEFEDYAQKTQKEIEGT